MKIKLLFIFVITTSLLFSECNGSPDNNKFKSKNCSKQDTRVLEKIKSYNNHHNNIFSIGSQVWNNNHLTKLTLNNYGDKFYLSDLFHLTSLKELSINHVEILDSMNANIENLRYLESLIINFTNLSGNINVGIGKLEKLIFLSLDHNNLSGMIPKSLFNLNLLKGLSLDHNQLSGNISKRIGDLKNLTHLHLDENQFSGVLPKTIIYLNNLKVLHLSYNDFEKLPNEICNLSLDKIEITLYGNKLCNREDIPKCFENQIGFQNCY